uniref:ribonuclease H n=1 Tax=Kryptolebias marmoratus TaxID=37003 RepID=A0A3Q3B4W6_KRYMA
MSPEHRRDDEIDPCPLLRNVMTTIIPRSSPSTVFPPPVTRDVSSSSPERYSGESSCGGFLLQCALVFNRSPQSFPSDGSRISYIVGLLNGKALRWAEARFKDPLDFGCSFQSFLNEFRMTFSQEPDTTSRSRRLWNLRQGVRSVAEYAIDFRTLAASSGWDACALKSAFFQSLNDSVKDELTMVEEPTELNDLILLAIKVDNRLRERRRQRGRSTVVDGTFYRARPVVEPGEAEPMQLGRARLSAAEKRRRRESDLCLYCGSPDHFVVACPFKAFEPGAGAATRGGPSDEGNPMGRSLSSKSPRFALPAVIQVNQDSLELSALVDSGCEQNLIDKSLVSQLNIKTVRLEAPIRVTALDGRGLHTITHQTESVQLIISGNHHEMISFFVFPSPNPPIVLGFKWLQLHNPHLNWTQGRVEAWSPECLSSCLQSAVPHRPSSLPAPQKEADLTDLGNVPREYHDLREVFSKNHALSLPPHRPYDCAINLLAGASLPSSRLYNISRPERQAMERYINESLRAGIIRHSSSPLGAGFFFVGKKDGTLRPCIDYRGLNQITVKNRYPLPLLSSAFETVQGMTVFSKLDLRNAYHLVRIRQGDEWKTAFKTPLGQFEYLVIPTAVRLRLPSSLRVHPTFHVSRIKPVLSSPLCPPAASPPPARELGGHPVYTVRRIVDARRRGRGWQFLVDWEGYGPEDRSWVPRSFICDPTLITDFWASRPSGSSGLPGGSR